MARCASGEGVVYWMSNSSPIDDVLLLCNLEDVGYQKIGHNLAVFIPVLAILSLALLEISVVVTKQNEFALAKSEEITGT